jgi:hypothetical protein
VIKITDINSYLLQKTGEMTKTIYILFSIIGMLWSGCSTLRPSVRPNEKIDIVLLTTQKDRYAVGESVKLFVSFGEIQRNTSARYTLYVKTDSGWQIHRKSAITLHGPYSPSQMPPYPKSSVQYKIYFDVPGISDCGQYRIEFALTQSIDLVSNTFSVSETCDQVNKGMVVTTQFAYRQEAQISVDMFFREFHSIHLTGYGGPNDLMCKMCRKMGQFWSCDDWDFSAPGGTSGVAYVMGTSIKGKYCQSRYTPPEPGDYRLAVQDERGWTFWSNTFRILE